MQRLPNILQRKYFLSVALVVVAACGIWYFSKPLSPTHVKIGEKSYALEIARTEDEQHRGLSERDSLCSQCAMLFVFPSAAKVPFWMKDMRFSLDIVWLLGDRVVFIERNISPDSQSIYFPESDADRVLELNAGEAESLHVGDSVLFY